MKSSSTLELPFHFSDSAPIPKNPFDTHEAATFLGFSSYTLRRSRSTGKLAGVPAPRYRRIGKKVIYEPLWLAAWRDQFKPQNNTAQNVA